MKKLSILLIVGLALTLIPSIFVIIFVTDHNIGCERDLKSCPANLICDCWPEDYGILFRIPEISIPFTLGIVLMIIGLFFFQRDKKLAGSSLGMKVNRTIVLRCV